MPAVLDRPNTDVDLSVLEGLDFELRCESEYHDTQRNLHGDGAATHFMRASCDSCGYVIEGFRCQKLADSLRTYIMQDRYTACDCGRRMPAKEFLKVLEKI